MAKLPALISVIADFDPERGRNAVENLSRELRKAGLVTTGKSGVGAPHLTATDVTNMLLGLVTRQSNEAPEAVKMLREAESPGPWEGKPDRLLDFQHFPFFGRAFDNDRHIRAGRFLDCLIEDLIKDGVVRAGAEGDPVFQIQLDVKSPMSGFGAAKVTFRPGWPDEISVEFECPRPSAKLGIQNGVTISGEVLMTIIDAMGKGNNSD
jgi:hypothetical protein